MSQPPSAAERLDRAVDGVLGGLSPFAAAAAAGSEPASRPLVMLAADLRTTLAAPPVAPRFEARLGARLATAQTDGADHKSRLQEQSAQLFSTSPRYEVEATGPDHARMFFVTATIAGVVYGRGEGRSKKQAEQAAARAAVEALVDQQPELSRETHHG